MASTIVVRLGETAAVTLIGDGVVGLLQPVQHIARWESGPAWWKRALGPLVGNPRDTRAFAVAEIAAGIALIWLLPPRRP
jgi:hypothetical protein